MPGCSLLTAIGPVELPRLSEISLDGRSVGFTLILSVLSGLFFGAIPALRYAPSRQRLTLLGAMRTASVSRERQRGRNLLVVAQVAMALVLLIGAVLMIRTFMAMRDVDPGFSDPASLQVMRLSIPETLVRDSTTVVRMQNSILDKLAAIPGVSSAGFAASVPMSGAEPSWDQILIEGKNYEGAESSHASLQLRLARILPHRRHTVRRWTRLHLGGDLRREADRNRIRGPCPRAVGIAPRRTRQAVPGVSRHALA